MTLPRRSALRPARHPHRLGLALALALALLAPAFVASAQGGWSWPEEPRNLQALSPDTGGQKLRAVMTGFSRALGVRCHHCHVGEEGQPFGEWDFASDAKPAKQTAREMLGLLKSVNDGLASMESRKADRVNVRCHTCHAGRPVPWTLDEALLVAYEEGGAPALVARYGELRERYHGRGAYDFAEERLDGLGHRLLGEGDTAGAIAVFRLNLEQYPESAKAHDSLAAAYTAAGQDELARQFYGRSLVLDPDNRNALAKLKLLRSGTAPAEDGG